MNQEIHPLIIIGGGPAGLTSAIYASRGNLKPLVFVGMNPGGQLGETTMVENFPGFPEGIMGPELMRRFRQQAENFGAQMLDKEVKKVDFSQSPFLVEAGEEKYYSKSVILATGATARWLGIPSETRLRGKGISACATCDGPMFRDKDVVVIGGGDAAMEEALFLVKYVKSVTIIHRRDEFRATQIMLNRAHQNPKIKLVKSTVVSEFLGQNKLEGIILENIETGQKSELKIEGAFLAIGHTPNTAIFKEFLTLGKQDYIVATNPPYTELEGIFIAGDCYDYTYRQAITAAGSGCKAAIAAEKYLESLKRQS